MDQAGALNQAFGGRTCSRNTYVVRFCFGRRRKPTTASRSPNCASTRWSGRRSKPITSARGLRGTWTRFDIEPEQGVYWPTPAPRFDIEPEWATEAALDPRARIGLDPSSKTGEGIRVTGRSIGAGRVLTVVLLPAAHPPTGSWLGATSWVTKGRDLRDYREEEE